MVTRIGVDVGGTFTDLVYVDQRTGATVEAKVATTSGAPEQGVLAVVARHVPRPVLHEAAYFLHGTTVGLNALLERSGARLGLITTEGFRDSIEIRRGDRAEIYNLGWVPPEPLVPRYLRLGIAERMRASGQVHRPLDAASVVAALATFTAEAVESIAVCLINAYVNPAHELATERVLRAHGYAGAISLSHRISGEYREYERCSTTLIDAYVRPAMEGYLSRLQLGLAELGFAGECLINRSGGGAMSFEQARRRPFETIMSGPVAGAQGAGRLARDLDLPAVIAADVGGTSFDTTLIVGGAHGLLYEGTIDNMPILAPWIDLRSIGAGGGSLAQVDAGGLLHVGPHSAGAQPGPACYGRGGTVPTTTDAAAHLGLLGPGRFASGVKLDFSAAQAALTGVSATIGLDTDATAVGILRIATAAMCEAITQITVERGLDPRTMTLMPFGGAGPMMAVLLADHIGLNDIVVPPLAGNFSAFGLLDSDLVQTAARTVLVPLDRAGLAAAKHVLAQLQLGLDAEARAKPTALLHLRYRGQEHSLTVEATPSDFDGDGTTLVLAFRDRHRATFGTALEQGIEIVAVRAASTIRLSADVMPAPSLLPVSNQAAVGTWRAYSFADGDYRAFTVIDRAAIAGPIHGPAIVGESTATLYLDAGWVATPAARGALRVTRHEPRHGS